MTFALLASTTLALLASTTLAFDENDVKPGWVALVIVLALGAATYLLWRSMNNQLGKIKVPKKGPPDEPPDRDNPSETPPTS